MKFHAAVMCGYKKKNDIRYVCSITITEVYSTQCDFLAGASYKYEPILYLFFIYLLPNTTYS